MFPVTNTDKFSREKNDVRGQVPPSGLGPEGMDHRRASVRDGSEAATPQLQLEKESTRRDRVARAREKQRQADVGGEVWSCIWSVGREQSEDTLIHVSESRERCTPALALAPEPPPPMEVPLHDRTPLPQTDPLRASTPAEICPELARRSVVAAKKADAEGNWHAALEQYTLAVAHGSRDPQVHFRMGMLLRQTHGDLRQSLAHLRKATLLRPDHIKYRSALADFYDLLGFPINARSQRERIRQLEADAAATRARGRH